MKKVKTVEQPLTLELVQSLVGHFVYVPTNTHIMPSDLEESGKEVNSWFAGQVAGVETTSIKYNYVLGVFQEEPTVFVSLLLTDGVGYTLSKTACEINIITETEFNILVEEHKKQNDKVVEFKRKQIH